MLKTASQIADSVLEKYAKEEKKREALFKDFGQRAGDYTTPLSTLLWGKVLRRPLIGAALGATDSRVSVGENVGKAIGATGGAMAGGMGAGLGAMALAKALKMQKPGARKMVGLLNLLGTMGGATIGNRVITRTMSEAKDSRTEAAAARKAKKLQKSPAKLPADCESNQARGRAKGTMAAQQGLLGTGVGAKRGGRRMNQK